MRWHVESVSPGFHEIKQISMTRLRVVGWGETTGRRRCVSAPGDHVVTVTDLALKPATAPATLLEELAESERDKIAAMLKHVSGSRTEAARALGIPRTTLLNKIRRYGLG